MSLDEIVRQIHPISKEWVERAREHTAHLAIPLRALGRLHDIAERVCGICGTLQPDVAAKAFLVMAGDHGVVSDGVSAFPQEVTGEMVKNFLRDGASINVLARHAGAEVLVVDMGIISDVDPGLLGRPKSTPYLQGGQGYGQHSQRTCHEPPSGRAVNPARLQLGLGLVCRRHPAPRNR